jgi:hypothetical protein
MTTAIAIAGLTVALLNVVVSVWAWRRRRAAADSRRIRKSLEQLRGTFGDGTGLAFKDHGAFTGKGLEAYKQLRDDMPFVVDRKLRNILNELVKTSDTAQNSALKFDSNKGDRMVFEVVAARFERPDHPVDKAPMVFKKALDRLAILERSASGL